MKFYKVTKRFGKCKVGNVLSDSDYRTRRKLAEGGCLEETTDPRLKNNIRSGKSMPGSIENKALAGASENKGGRK